MKVTGLTSFPATRDNVLYVETRTDQYMLDVKNIGSDILEIPTEELLYGLHRVYRYNNRLRGTISCLEHTHHTYMAAKALYNANAGELRHIILNDVHKFITGDIIAPVRSLLHAPGIKPITTAINDSIFNRHNVSLDNSQQNSNVLIFNLLTLQTEFNTLAVTQIPLHEFEDWSMLDDMLIEQANSEEAVDILYNALDTSTTDAVDYLMDMMNSTAGAHINSQFIDYLMDITNGNYER